MRIIYRISDAGYSKVKPDYINNENCLANAVKVFDDCEWSIIADNVSKETSDMIEKYKSKDHTVYFLENDYLHKPDSRVIIEEGLSLGAQFVSLYDHPDKYIGPDKGGNPYCEGGAEDTRVYLTESTHWKITNSTTMTFAAQVSTLRENESVLRHHTSGVHPEDFKMFLELRYANKLLVTPIPGYATHGETAWLSPLNDWKKTAIWNKI